jgi:hypothetical protein
MLGNILGREKVTAKKCLESTEEYFPALMREKLNEEGSGRQLYIEKLECFSTD